MTRTAEASAAPVDIRLRLDRSASRPAIGPPISADTPEAITKPPRPLIAPAPVVAARLTRKGGLSADTSSRLRTTTKFRKGLRSEEHTSELQSRGHLVCRLLLEKNID